MCVHRVNFKRDNEEGAQLLSHLCHMTFRRLQGPFSSEFQQFPEIKAMPFNTQRTHLLLFNFFVVMPVMSVVPADESGDYGVSLCNSGAQVAYQQAVFNWTWIGAARPCTLKPKAKYNENRSLLHAALCTGAIPTPNTLTSTHPTAGSLDEIEDCVCDWVWLSIDIFLMQELEYLFKKVQSGQWVGFYQKAQVSRLCWSHIVTRFGCCHCGTTDWAQQQSKKIKYLSDCFLYFGLYGGKKKCRPEKKW